MLNRKFEIELCVGDDEEFSGEGIEDGVRELLMGMLAGRNAAFTVREKGQVGQAPCPPPLCPPPPPYESPDPCGPGFVWPSPIQVGGNGQGACPQYSAGPSSEGFRW